MRKIWMRFSCVIAIAVSLYGLGPVLSKSATVDADSARADIHSMSGARFSPIFEQKLKQSIDGFDRVGFYYTGTLPAKKSSFQAISLDLSACLFSVCVGSVCFGSVCLGSACAGSVCVGSTCIGSGCSSSNCIGSSCVGSVCGASQCTGSTCLGSTCSDSGCIDSTCINSGCIGSTCVNGCLDDGSGPGGFLD